jgi:hypothetical protein
MVNFARNLVMGFSFVILSQRDAVSGLIMKISSSPASVARSSRIPAILFREVPHFGLGV